MERVRVLVPVRGCDVGGWTDTWFAGEGRVCSLALGPGVTVDAWRAAGEGATIEVAATGERFALDEVPPRHRLLAEAIAEAAPVPTGIALRVGAGVPPGASLGTSASVCVGVIAAVDALAGRAVRPPAELAAAAHRVEGERMGRQSGVQDQLAAAHGGANRIDVRYPDAVVTPVPLEPEVRSALDERLLHIAYGGPHDSSAVHQQVIDHLEGQGPSSAQLADLRALALDGASALATGDLDGWGAVLTAATEAQRSLHAELVSADAQALIDAAAETGADGWKVNGAGGAGGSLSVLCSDGGQRRTLADRARRLGHLPLELRLAERGAHVLPR